MALLKAWRQISLMHSGVELTFHDLRKVSITWLYAMDIPLEIATEIARAPHTHNFLG
ncbi:MAG: hypothetical protein ACYS5F_15865 [Planctomycetota bacterium]|jgi:hypothetical protein